MNLILLFVIASIFSTSLLALTLQRLPRVQKTIVFTLTGISGVLAVCVGLITLLTQQNISYEISSTFPNLAWQFRLDPLSSFFLIIIGIVVISMAFYAPGYICTHEKQHSPTTMYFFTGLFIGSMCLVLLAHDLFTFMFSWELMSVSSYFLVIYNHEHAANRRAALIYLLMAQASGLLILFAFSILVNFTNSMSFDVWHSIKFSSGVANLAFFLAFFGFGMKAGVVPLHIWLPKAHPAAPSHISALMSGVMLKVSVYGLLRFAFYLLRDIHWQWGVVALFVGTISALFGILCALMQNDLKKLLAYSSVENIGIIFSAIGLSLIFASTGHNLLAALGLIAALYHCLNHALFKSLLFFGAGAISQYTHGQDLECMGGLIKKMPYTSWCFLIGCISISALPPFNGFISEWLFFQTALQAPILKSEIMRTLIPVAAALIALTTALAATCFVKVYGIAFLGQPRSQYTGQTYGSQLSMKFAMGFLALLCLFFGIFPTFAFSALNVISHQLIGIKLLHTQNWLWLIPISDKTSSYNPLWVSVGIIFIGFISYYLLRVYYGNTKTREIKPWDCGYGAINQRMQYSATAFTMPLRRVFHNFWSLHEKLETTGYSVNYSLQVDDLIRQRIYLPLERFSFTLARFFARLQGGNVRVYLTYMFITLILLLWIIA